MNETTALLHAIIERLDVQGANIESLTHQVNHLMGDVVAMKADIVDMKADIVDIKADIDIMKADITEIKDGQLRQDKILETLALRSLEQETDIRHIRQAN